MRASSVAKRPRWQLVWAGGDGPTADQLEVPAKLIAEDLQAWERGLGIGPSTPILISPDYQFDQRLIEFFTSGTFQSKSEKTRQTYGPEIRIWLDFLWPKDWADADEDDLARFKAWRTNVALPPGPAETWADSFDEPGRRIKGATWDKGVAALNFLYNWAANPRRSFVAANPVPDSVARRRGRQGGGGGALTRAKSKDAQSQRYRWISPATYRVLVDVGVRRFSAVAGSEPGKLVVGLPDPTHRARNIDRNRAAFETAYYTGIRREEFGSLLLQEVPLAGLAAMRLADATCKYNRGRSVLIPQVPITRIQEYLRLERRAAVRRGQRRGLFDLPNLIRVERIEQAPFGSQRVKVHGGPWLDINDIGVRDRARLVIEGEVGWEPMWLFLTEIGSPFMPELWQDPFVAASSRVSVEGERCGAWPAGKGIRVTPHSLRFSFALLYLMALHEAIDERYPVEPQASYDPYRYLMAYQRVQSQLGHASVGITLNTYLNPFRELRTATELLHAHEGIHEAMTALSRADGRVLDIGT